ncbi:MAG: LysM peptidoglycan-binding domain-containing protein [Actinobacteria bacterium]|nr:LysM peptidoglycan-binding domain-containing protein [Actinomycetota bacterium]
MITRVRSVAAGLAALATLGAITAGLPLVLYRFGGSPLPGRLPDWHELPRLLGSREDAGLLFAIIRDCAWLAWLLFTACVLAEIQAVIRGRQAPHLRLGGIQGVAARLVTLAALTVSAPAMVTLPASVTQLVALDSLTSPGAAQPATTVVVQPGDCLWSIAQRYLGAGDRYTEIARLNYGRDMGDGATFTNPSVIDVGWRLLLPTAAARAATPAASPSPSGQHLGHATTDPRYQRRHAAAHDQRGNRVASSRSSGPAGSGSGGSGAADAAAASLRPAAHSVHVPDAAVFVTGAVAGAIVMALTRMRFRQRQRRRPGRRIGIPADPYTLATEQRLRATARGEPVQTLRDALAILEAGLQATGQQLPDIVGVHVTPDVLEVLLSAPAADAPPAPYEVSPGRQGMCWRLPLPAVSGLTGPCHLLPGLVTAGATDAGYLLLDLESLQVTGCDGPDELVDLVITTMATELATGQWSSWFELILVGFSELASLGSPQNCQTLDEALSILEARCARIAQRMAEQTPADVRKLRLTQPDNEDWGLAVLVSRAEPSTEEITRLLDVAVDSWGGIAALVAGDAEAADGRMAPTVLQVAPDSEVDAGIVANVVPLQIMVRPRVLSAADYDAVATLFSAAADDSDVGPEDSPYAVYAEPPAGPSPVSQVPVSSASAHGLDVKILGPLVITGAAEELQPKQAELVLALALAAPAGLSNSALCSMLGADPDHPKPSDSVRQIITRTRRRLGPASDGQERIIHVGNAQYRLHPDVSLDWSRFRELSRSGLMEDLRAALELVRGEPFADGYFWWIDIPLIETVRAEIVDAAEKLAELELAAGAHRAAARAARAGLAAEPSAEQLWRMAMRAEHLAGNMAGVTEAWRHCLDAIEDIAPGGEPHPDTVMLYRQLTAPKPQPARMS